MYSYDWAPFGAIPLLGRGMMITLEVTLTAIFVGIVWGTLLACPARPQPCAVAAFRRLRQLVPLGAAGDGHPVVLPDRAAGHQAIFGDDIGDIRMASALVAFALFGPRTTRRSSAPASRASPGPDRRRPRPRADAGQTMRLVVLPQAFRNMTPLLLTQAIILFQDTSLVYVIGLSDFFGTASRSATATGGWSRCCCLPAPSISLLLLGFAAG